MTLLGDVLFVAIFLAFLMFCVLYSLISRWWENPAGRNVFALMALLAGLFGLGVLRLAIGPDWFDRHRDWLRVVCYGSLLGVVVWRIVLMVRIQLGFNHQQEKEKISSALLADQPPHPGAE